MDESGKATLIKALTTDARVYGMSFHIDTGDLIALDRAEGRGHGYNRIDDFRVELEPNGAPLTVSTYIGTAESLNPKLSPYDWYLKLIIAGATQNGLPSTYINTLRTIPNIADPDPNRPARIEALKLLAATQGGNTSENER